MKQHDAYDASESLNDVYACYDENDYALDFPYKSNPGTYDGTQADHKRKTMCLKPGSCSFKAVGFQWAENDWNCPVCQRPHYEKAKQINKHGGKLRWQ